MLVPTDEDEAPAANLESPCRNEETQLRLPPWRKRENIDHKDTESRLPWHADGPNWIFPALLKPLSLTGSGKWKRLIYIAS